VTFIPAVHERYGSKLGGVGLFRVEISIPPDETHHYRRNLQTNVLTSTAQKAIEVTLARHSGAEVHSVHRLSSTAIIVDGDIFDGDV